MSGKLIIVATPIGNLGDLSIRAKECLETCDLIVSEDTRESQKLLNFLGISKPQISYRDENHYHVAPKIISELKSGTQIAFVTDRGTPLISDPGYKLVALAIENEIEVDSIPGPSAVIDSLILSGIPTDKFVFLGFLPKKKFQSAKILEKFGHLEASLIIFENPRRLKETLQSIYEALGDRNVALCIELTKIHQKVIRFNLQDLEKQDLKGIGETTIVISK